MKADRILIRGLNWLGDAVMSLPLFHSIRNHFPRAHLSVLTVSKLQGFYHGQKVVDSVISIEPNESVFSAARLIRRENFDLAFVLPNSPRSALEVFLARVPVRIGRKTWDRSWFLTDGVQVDSARFNMLKRRRDEVATLCETGEQETRSNPTELSANHHVFQYLELLGALDSSELKQWQPGGLLLNAPLELGTELASVVSSMECVIGLNPGAEYGPAKRWPAERFTAVANWLSERKRCGFVIFGGKADQTIAGQIERGIAIGRSGKKGVLNLAGKTTLPELMSWMKRCDVVITNDTGPMHIAAAIGTSVVAVFGSTSSMLTGPSYALGSRHRIVRTSVGCSPCFLKECPIDLRCLKRVEVEHVGLATLELLTSNCETRH